MELPICETSSISLRSISPTGVEGLMARAVVVIDEDGRVIYTQLVKTISDEPDYEVALKALQ